MADCALRTYASPFYTFCLLVSPFVKLFMRFLMRTPRFSNAGSFSELMPVLLNVLFGA
jgi:hypothetical protein